MNSINKLFNLLSKKNFKTSTDRVLRVLGKVVALNVQWNTNKTKLT